MAISDKLQDLLDIKQDIKTAIETKGIPMTNVAFTEYANKILDIRGDFFEEYFELASAETKEEKLEVLDGLELIFGRWGRDDVLDIIKDYRDENDLWPDEPIILGVLGEPAENTVLSRYEENSYEINPQLVEIGNLRHWVWDDTKWPFNQITEVVDIYNNKFIKIPKMYILAVKSNNRINERYISDQPLSGYELPKCFIDENNNELDYILIGKYNLAKDGNDRATSVSGVEPLTSTTLADFRTYATNNNANGESGYQLFDMHIKFVLETLYLIVFADTNSDKLFPQGATGVKQNNGALDGLGHHTGYTTDLANYLMTFLGIENYFSNIYTQVDGVKINYGTVYVCDKPSLYNSKSNTTNYYAIGSTPSSDGYIKELGSTQGLFSIPLTGSGSNNEWYSDYLYQTTGSATLYFGRNWSSDSKHGLFNWRGDAAITPDWAVPGARLVKRPLP